MAENRLYQTFTGFDSIDPRMRRVPFDLRDPELRQEYIENHKRWFLKNHENDIGEFEKEVSRLYDHIKTRKKAKPAKAQTSRNDLFASSQTGN
jgi:site-specific DNA-methyltransferase (adenine-specific)